MRNLEILILCFVLNLVHSTSKELKKCNEKDVLAIRKCRPLVEKFKALKKQHQESKKSQKLVRQFIDSCEDIEECMYEIRCEEAAILKKQMDNTCRILYYFDADNRKCVDGFFKEAYLAEYSNVSSCFKDHAFLADDLFVRKHAFINGEACFINYVKKSCTENAKIYFFVNYEKFIDHFSIKPEGSDCKLAPFYSLHSYYCKQIMLEVSRRSLDVSKFEHPSIPNIIHMCHDMQKCFQQPCTTPNSLVKQLEETCRLLEEEYFEYRRNKREL